MDHRRCAGAARGRPRRAAGQAGEREGAENRRPGSEGGPGRGMETDVPRGVADRARFLLRPSLPWPGPRSRRRALRRLPERPRIARRFELPVHRDARQHHGGAHVSARRRPAGGEARFHRAAGCRLQNRKRALPFRPRVQRRELEPRYQGAAHAARRQCEHRGLSAGGGRTGAARRGQHLQFL